jgi:predicted phosphodiesterase
VTVKLGLLSDIHGNVQALDAVLDDGRRQGVDRWWALGDLVAIGPDPVGVLERLDALPLEAVRGNTDRFSVSNDRPPPYAEHVRADPDLIDVFAAVARSFAWTGGVVAATGWAAWLAALPVEIRTVLPDGTRVLGVHVVPGMDDGPSGITPHRPDDELAADLDGAEADLVCAGHTHQPTDRWVGDVHAVNLGSVSNPVTDDLRASYVVVHADADGHRVEHRRVAYDRDAFLAAVAASGHPEADFIASFQRGEQFRFPALRPGAPVPSG